MGRIGSGSTVSASFQKKSRRVQSYDSKGGGYDPGGLFGDGPVGVSPLTEYRHILPRRHYLSLNRDTQC